MGTDNFLETLANFKKVASDLNSTYYSEEYDKKYSKKLWELIKEVEALPNKIEMFLVEHINK